MLFTHRHSRSVAVGTGGLILLAAIGAAIAEAPSGPPAASGDHAPGRVPPKSVALNPTAGGGTDPGLHLRVPGRTTTARGVRAPRARLGDAAGAVTLVVPPRAPGRSPADGGTISVPPATEPGDTQGGGADSGQQENGPGGGAESGTAIGAHVSLLGLVVGANATLR